MDKRCRGGWALLVVSLLAVGCAQAPVEKGPVKVRSLGHEIYLVLCEHLAGTEFPNDVTGRKAALPVCSGHQPAPIEGERGHRLEALRQNRDRLVSALDTALEHPAVYDELFDFSLDILPLYDPPREALPHATRAVSAVLNRLMADPNAMQALQRVGGRQGYRPLLEAMGMLRAVFQYPRLEPFLRTLLAATDDPNGGRDEFDALVRAVGMELSAFEAVPPGEEGTMDVVRELLLRRDPAFARQAPGAYLVERDRRGFAQPSAAAVGTLIDKDGDELADVDEKGRFVDATGAPLEIPAPFETASFAPTMRAADGRAVDAEGAPLYEYMDAQQTFFAGASDDLKAWFAPRDDPDPARAGHSTLLDLLYGLQPALGEPGTGRTAFGNGALDYPSSDLANAPLMQLMDFAALVVEAPELDRSIELIDRVLTEHEPVAAGLARAMFEAKAVADLNTTAHIVQDAPFWDDMVWLLERFARRRGVEGQTALEGLMRGIADPRARHLGALLALPARYKDPIDINPDDINAEVVGTYQTRVDRSMPDIPGNQAQLERFLLLVSELMNRPLCNKKTTGGALLRALGMGGIGIDLAADFITIEECGFMKVPDLGRAFGMAMTGDLDLMDYISNETLAALTPAFIGDEGFVRDLLDDIFTTQSGIDEFDTTPTGAAFVRILFYPPNSQTAEFAEGLFYPFTMKPYTVQFSEADFEALGATREQPPEHLRLDRVYEGALAFWEVPWDFGDGEAVTLQESIIPLLEALNAHDYVEGESDPNRFDSELYMFNPMAGIIGENYPSPANADEDLVDTNALLQTDPTKPNYSRMSNLVSYEPIIADMLAGPPPVANEYFDDGQAQWFAEQPAVDLYGALWQLMNTLDELDMGGGEDGIDVLASLAERLLNAQLYCDPDASGVVNLRGQGACHRSDSPRPPLSFRGGEDFLTWADGEAHDGTGEEAMRAVSPLQLLFKALNDYDDIYERGGPRRADGTPTEHPRKVPWRTARSEMVDRLFETDGERFLNPNLLPMLRHTMTWARRRLAVYHDAGGDQAVRNWAATLPGRAETFVGSPVMTGLLSFASAMQDHPGMSREMGLFLQYMMDDSSGSQGQGHGHHTFLLSVIDMLQILRDQTNVPPLMHAAGSALVPNAHQVLSAGAPVSEAPSDLHRTLSFLRDMVAVDTQQTMPKILARLVSESPLHREGRIVPLETILEVVAEVNRTVPNAGSALDEADLTQMLWQTQDFLTDEKRGLERMYRILQARTLDPGE